MRRLPWPLPALLAWLSAWAVFLLTVGFGLHPVVAALLAGLAGLAWSVSASTRWRQAFLVLGFPLSLALGTGMLGVAPGWVWLLPLLVLVLLYPLNAWRDAPLFPTPAQALRELPGAAPLPEGALVLDAGCGLGHGLQALRQAYPQATLHGIEWSWPLRVLCALRCPWARVHQGDIWRADWSAYALVYLFQRPESMTRAAAQALAQLRPGAWLVSLEFEAPALRPQAVLRTSDGRPVWLYRAPFTPAKDGRSFPGS